MSAFLTSLGSIAGQYGEAKSEKQTEDFAREQKLKELSTSDAYLQLAKQAEKRQADEFEQRKKSGDLIEFKDGRIWSVSQSKFIDQQRPDPMTTLKKFIDSQPPDVRKNLTERAQAEVELSPNDPKSAIQEVMKFADAQQAESNRKAEAATRHQEHEGDVASQHEFQKTQRKEMETFQRLMVSTRLEEKAKFMTPQERQQYESIKSLEPMVTRLRTFIEKNKLEGENNYIFGDHSALVQHLRSRGYKFGVAQEPKTQELIKDAAAISIMGAAPWVRIGRGKYTLEQIQQHLPKQTDTPGNIYDKVTWLQDEVLENAKNSLSGLTPPGGGSASPTQAAPDNGAPPPGAVIHDFSKD